MIWVIENIKMALTSILTHKLRSLLTMLGVIIGIVSVSLMGAAISGVNNSFENSMSLIGNNVINIDRFPWQSEQDWWKYVNRPNLKEEYAYKIMERSKFVDYAIPCFDDYVDIKYGKHALNRSTLIGTSSSYQKMFDLGIDAGRFFSTIEDKNALRVAVIGFDIKNKLFKGQDPIGKRINIEGIHFKVIGILREQGKLFGIFSMDDQILVPFSTVNEIKTNIEEDLFISAKIKKGSDTKTANDELTMVMREIRGLKPLEKNDFSFNHQEIFREQLNVVRYSIAAAGVGLTSLSLFVGGIGIMNIMFVSVRERTREIGIRKALGATKNKILFQFLCESTVISSIGGIIGIVITIFFVEELNKYLIATVSFKLILISLTVSLLTGILSGALPAMHAASLDPVEAMRRCE